MKPELPTFKLTIIANNQAGNWTSWDAKISAIRAFYAPNCNLDITLVKAALTPEFVPFEPNVYRVDPDWYADGVVPLATGADIVMFVVPPSDHTKTTPMGIETGKPLGIWQTTVFCNESTHTYVGVVDQGDTFSVYALHELAHTFYAMLGKTDNTHLYFCAGMPERVLADLNFAETVITLQGMVTALTSIYNYLKRRYMKSTPTQSLFPAKILAWAKIITQEEGGRPEHNNPGNLGYSTLTASWGATRGPAKSDGGYLAVFPTAQAGQNALCNFLVLGCENQLLAFHQARTLGAFTDVYANHPPTGYKNAIVNAMGGDPNVQISTFLS